MNRRVLHFAVAIGATLLYALVVQFLAAGEPGSTSYRLGQLLGAEFPIGFIQHLTFFLFVLGCAEVFTFFSRLRYEEEGLRVGILPTREHFVLDPEQVARIKLKISKDPRYSGYEVSKLIVSACTKYRAEYSVGDAMQLVSAQARMKQHLAESDQTLVQYVLWAIPSVGFIGTVLGIAGALNYAGTIETDGIEKVTSTLYVAFDTTLLSLILSVILMLAYNILQGRVERLYVEMEDYIMENLINRIFKQ